MPVQRDSYFQLLQEVSAAGATLIAVSKKKSVAEIQELYDLGHRDFGENYVQELVQKVPLLPTDIRWHFIGHLQRNKVKMILPFCTLIQGIDRYELLEEINKQAVRMGRTVDCLLQVHIASEETKFGLDATELASVLSNGAQFPAIRIIGLMGMASLTENTEQIRTEFKLLKKYFDNHRTDFNVENPVLSMGMSGDYKLALQEGSTMIRVGSLLFGARS